MKTVGRCRAGVEYILYPDGRAGKKNSPTHLTHPTPSRKTQTKPKNDTEKKKIETRTHVNEHTYIRTTKNRARLPTNIERNRHNRTLLAEKDRTNSTTIGNQAKQIMQTSKPAEDQKKIFFTRPTPPQPHPNHRQRTNGTNPQTQYNFVAQVKAE